MSFFVKEYDIKVESAIATNIVLFSTNQIAEIL